MGDEEIHDGGDSSCCIYGGGSGAGGGDGSGGGGVLKDRLCILLHFLSGGQGK